MNLVILWLAAGFIGGWLGNLYDYLNRGYITLGGILATTVGCVFGPFILLYTIVILVGYMFRTIKWDFLDKKVFVKKGK